MAIPKDYSLIMIPTKLHPFENMITNGFNLRKQIDFWDSMNNLKFLNFYEIDKKNCKNRLNKDKVHALINQTFIKTIIQSWKRGKLTI